MANLTINKKMDFKGFILFGASLLVGNVNEILTTCGLTANFIYIGYQIYTHHKENKDK